MTASRTPVPVSRRGLVRGAAALGATAGAGLAGSALLTSAAAAAAVDASPADFVAADPLLHLLRRATYGPTPDSIADIRSLGAAAWLNRQLDPLSIPDAECDAVVARLPLRALTIDGVRARVKAGTLPEYGWEVMQQLGYSAMARAIWSNRQLYEVMVDFWSNHLNVTCPSGEVWDSRQDYDRAVIRRHTLGRFADMLRASALHPAMLSYLDNRHSTRSAPNENYGRELLELHTVGLVHSEADVKNAARLLTGLTVSWDTGRYRYDGTRHATGAVSVLGFSHPNRTESGGQTAALAMLDYLALHPATAKRLAYKLCVRFVSDNPPAALVFRLTKVYLDNRSAIAPVLRALFTSAEFAAAVGRKVRTPLEDVAATVRVLALRPEQIVEGSNPNGIEAVKALFWTVGDAGHGPMSWAPPDGYPDMATAWASPSGQLIRWNAHLNIAAGWWPTQLTRPTSLIAEMVPTLPATYGALMDAVATRLFGRTLKAEHTAALAAFFGKTATSTLRPWHAAAGWQFPYLVALMLNSPYFAIR